MESRPTEAIPLYRSATAAYREFGVRSSLALAVLDMLALIGPADPAVRPLLDEGRAILADLRATVLLDRFDALVAGGTAATGAPEVVTDGTIGAASRRQAKPLNGRRSTQRTSTGHERWGFTGPDPGSANRWSERSAFRAADQGLATAMLNGRRSPRSNPGVAGRRKPAHRTLDVQAGRV